MANNSDLGCNCPCPDSGPDKNTETVGTTGDLNPMVYLSKLKNVQEHFGRQMLDVQFMLGRMETRAIRAETALLDAEKTIKKIVGTKADMEKIAEKTAKKIRVKSEGRNQLLLQLVETMYVFRLSYLVGMRVLEMY